MIGRVCGLVVLSWGIAFGQLPVVKPGAASGAASGSAKGASLHVELLHPTDPLPGYEVATIKPWSASGPAGYTIRTYIGWAYGVPFGSNGRIVGGPDWIGDQRYVIDGKISDAERAVMQAMSPEAKSREQGLLWQSLLAERCRLKAHFEMREGPIYRLVIAKGGLKMKEVPLSPDSRVGISMGKGGLLELKGTSVALSRIVELLPNDRPIVDETELRGRYDLVMDWANESMSAGSSSSGAAAGDSAAAELNGPSIFTALEEQLGLKLVPAKGSFEVVVIDSIERPSEN